MGGLSTLLDNIPALSKDLFTMSGRGASYIDTGLLEANEEVMLAPTATTGELELAQLSERLNALFYDAPEWKAQLGSQLSALPAASAFFERATNEVLQSLDQTSCEQFFNAGQPSIHSLQTLTSAAVEGTASGDLRLKSISHGKGEISSLVGAFSETNGRLSQLISHVLGSAQVITVVSREIANGNNELSSRTEHANQLALSASSFAVKGGQVVGEVVQTMESIQQSSDKILGIIDGYRFPDKYPHPECRRRSSPFKRARP